MSAISDIDIRDFAESFPPGDGQAQGASVPQTDRRKASEMASGQQVQLQSSRLDWQPCGSGLPCFRADLDNQLSGVKFDNDKPRMDLLDANFLEGVARVLTFGAQKYAANNWRNGLAVSRLIAATYRHLGAINRGEDNDPESNLPHVYHLGCCVMFLSEMLKRPEQDDRYKSN